MTLRTEPCNDDRAAVRAIIESSGFFYPDEVAVAVELVEERLSKGVERGYHFLFAEAEGQVLGYACFGPIPCSQHSYDLYWIAVHERQRGGGLGRMLLDAAEKTVAGMGGRRIYVETASRPQYAPTRAFYAACGYLAEAVLEDFYAPGDSKVIFVKIVGAAERHQPPEGVQWV
ncbi:MAG: GNAT family N-acetyltransferase [Deltaproteobacteria bacterium]|nr:GNAT family N-acetyltransferase [Deltaproteobacteria bacterium]